MTQTPNDLERRARAGEGRCIWARTIAIAASTPPDCRQVVRGMLPASLLETGLIARAEDRADPVLQMVGTAADLRQADQILDAMRTVSSAARPGLFVDQP